MLQRIQTLFLLSVVAMMVLFLIFPIWIGINSDTTITHRIYALFHYQVADNGAQEIVDYWPYAISGILGILSIIIAIVEIFSFKNRMTQIKLGALNVLIISVSLVTIIWFTNQTYELWPESIGKYGLGIFFPAMAIFSNMMANRFIRKDERLVKSMDRIR